MFVGYPLIKFLRWWYNDWYQFDFTASWNDKSNDCNTKECYLKYKHCKLCVIVYTLKHTHGLLIFCIIIYLKLLNILSCYLRSDNKYQFQNICNTFKINFSVTFTFSSCNSMLVVIFSQQLSPHPLTLFTLFLNQKYLFTSLTPLLYISNHLFKKLSTP